MTTEAQKRVRAKKLSSDKQAMEAVHELWKLGTSTIEISRLTGYSRRQVQRAVEVNLPATMTPTVQQVVEVTDEHRLADPKLEIFAQEFAGGAGFAGAYRTAMDLPRESPTNEASRIGAMWYRRPEVKARIAMLQELLVAEGRWARSDSVRALAELARSPRTPPPVVVSAVKELNAMHGFATVQVEVTNKEPRPHDLTKLSSEALLEIERMLQSEGGDDSQGSV